MDLAAAKVNIIPLEKNVQSPAGQVSARLNTDLLSSAVTVNVSEDQASNQDNSTRDLLISGSISPTYSGQPVSICINNDGVPTYLVALTDGNGDYNLTWNFTNAGTYYITASWGGISNYAGADSQTVPVFVGPQSFIQFDAGDYNIIYGQVGAAAFATAPMQGVNDFFTLPLGTNVSLSYSFIVLQAGQTISNVETTNVTLPAGRQTVLSANKTVETIQVPARNETIPVNVPIGLEPLRLPDNFNQTLDNQFCFILQNSNVDNYSLNIKGLSEEDLSGMQTNAAVTNATGNIKEDTWYQMTTNINDEGATTNLTDGNGTVIETTSSPANGNQAVLLITNNEDTAIVLKNLTIQTQNVAQQPQSTQKPTSNNGNTSLIAYVAISIILAATVTAILYVNKRKTSKNSQAKYQRKIDSSNPQSTKSQEQTRANKKYNKQTGFYT